MPEGSQLRRVNDILLGRLERPALQWMVRRLPGWVTPDLLTLVGFLGAVIVFAGYALSRLIDGFLWLSSLGFLVNWLGDSLDGTLARYRHIERPRYGFFTDHFVDTFVAVLIILGLGLTHYIKFTVSSLLAISFLLVCVFVYLNSTVNGVFKISFGRFGPTELRVMAVLLNCLMLYVKVLSFRLVFGVYTIYDLGIILLAIALLVVYFIAGARSSIELARLEQTRNPTTVKAGIVLTEQPKEEA